jgi:PAS domain-containing protein
VWDKGITTGGPFEIEFRLKRAADRAYRWQAVQVTPIRMPGGKISRWLGIGTDIHEKRVAVEELKGQRQIFQSMVETEWGFYANACEIASWNVGVERNGLRGV